MTEQSRSYNEVNIEMEGYLIRLLEQYFKLEDLDKPKYYLPLDLRPGSVAGKFITIGFSLKAPKTSYKVEEGFRKTKVILNEGQFYKIKAHKDYFVSNAVHKFFDLVFYEFVNNSLKFNEGIGIEQCIRDFEAEYDLINELYKPDMFRKRYFRIRKRMRTI